MKAWTGRREDGENRRRCWLASGAYAAEKTTVDAVDGVALVLSSFQMPQRCLEQLPASQSVVVVASRTESKCCLLL